eukprot:166214-Pelagomonas_calceolata.AAC.6
MELIQDAEKLCFGTIAKASTDTFLAPPIPVALHKQPRDDLIYSFDVSHRLEQNDAHLIFMVLRLLGIASGQPVDAIDCFKAMVMQTTLSQGKRYGDEVPSAVISEL